ncbi:MAG: type II toxin-antitoxin system RelE/ParE family toxin [Chloroflexi bacterium]|nr:type II toxin-antitoxin system RelE/ParE family toxin [Chloroflexota bacterium]
MGSYRVEITNAARREIRNLPGHMRQLIFREIQALEKEARPYSSKGMKSTKNFKISKDVELRRIRMDRWRVVYVIEQELSLVTVLAIRKRPPYQYEDLEDLLKEV